MKFKASNFKRGFSTINDLKRCIVLAKTSQNALKDMPKDSERYKQTMEMLESNLLQISSMMLSLELEYRNIHHFAKGADLLE